MRGELVRVGRGKKAHRRWDNYFTYCGIGQVDNSQNVNDLPLCKMCDRLYLESKVKELE